MEKKDLISTALAGFVIFVSLLAFSTAAALCVVGAFTQ